MAKTGAFTDGPAGGRIELSVPDLRRNCFAELAGEVIGTVERCDTVERPLLVLTPG